MRNTITTIIFCLVLLNVVGQPSNSENQLKEGDKAPTLTAYKWIKGEPITSFQKGKMYVIEFGATWCKPCAAAIPQLSALANQFADQIEVVSFFVMEQKETDENKTGYVETVEKYIEKRKEKITYSVAVDGPEKDMEKLWLRAAGKVGIPHIFLIDKEGKIAWIGSNPQDLKRILLTPNQQFNAFAPGNMYPKEVEFDELKLLLIEGNGGEESDFLFRSLLTRYDGKLRAANPDFIESFRQYDSSDPVINALLDRVQVIGASLQQLYYIAYHDTIFTNIHGRDSKWQYPDTVRNPHHKTAYGKFWHKPILEVKDLRPFNWNRNSPVNRYNYSLKVPAGTGTAYYLQNIMQNDLENYFGYSVKVEMRKMPYWSVTAPDKEKAREFLRSTNGTGSFKMTDDEGHFKFTNAIIRDIIWMLGYHFGYGDLDYGKLPPDQQGAFIDETGIEDRIDFEFDRNWSFIEFKNYLETRGIELSSELKWMKVIVIYE